MKLSTSRIRAVFTLQTLLIVLDVLINTFSIAYKKQHSILLIFFIVQDVCLILALALLLLTFFSTCVFQTGLAEFIYIRFHLTLGLCVFYFVLTTALYIWILSTHVERIWSTWFLLAFIAQRLTATFYYYFYKRAAMKICYRCFYDEMGMGTK